MGWDCTLHVVDDTSFARFSARFLHGLHRDAAFDREYDADDLISKVKQLIAKDPDTGARALGELALLYVSTETPHVYCRGFALSLWDDERMGASLPAKWLTSVETRLPDLLAAYPKLAKRIPRNFDQNYCVGPFVTARHVPALLAHVEKTLEAMAPGDQTPYRRLVDILKIAAARNLAYWEGTDIDVAQAHDEWLAPIRAASIQTAPSPLTSALALPIAIDGTRMLVGEFFLLHEVETSTFPPAVITHEGCQVIASAFTPWGTSFVRMATDRKERPFKFAYYELPERTPLTIAPGFPIGRARRGRDCVVLFPQPTTKEQAGVTPLVLRQSGLTPLALPEATIAGGIDCEAIPFGDGSLLVMWNKVPYRWDGTSDPVCLGGTLAAPDDLCAAVTLSDGSIVGGFGRQLIRIDREGVRTTLLPLDNVMTVLRGPDDVLIIGEGNNPDGDVLKLWWPQTRELTHITAAALGLDEKPTFTYFDATAELLVAARPGTWHAIAWSELAGMRRVSEDDFRAERSPRIPE